MDTKTTIPVIIFVIIIPGTYNSPAETGFYYCSSRYYDPCNYRFINADTQFDEGLGMLGHNLFLYCGNNPIMYSDPSGKGAILALAAIYACVGGLAGITIGSVFDDELVEAPLSVAAPPILQIMKCPVTKAFLEYALNGSGEEIHNQHLLEGYNAITEILVSAIKDSEEWKTIVTTHITNNELLIVDAKGVFGKGDLYYTVHGFEYWLKISPKGNNTYGIHVVLWDKFDFDRFWNIFKEDFVGAVANDIGRVNQLAGKLKPFKYWVNFGYDMTIA